MEYKSVFILTMIINACHKIDTLLSEVPKDTEVKINDSTYMNCSTSLLSNQVQWRHGNNYVYTGLAILEPYNARFSVEINASTGACNLVIRSVQPSDAGTYECADDEGTGDRRSVQLIVLDGDPVCKSNMNSDGVIGPNSCGIKPEEVELSCSIKYHGNSLPILQWGVSGDNQCVSGGRFKVTSIINEVTYTLTMKSTLGLNNSSFICQTTRTSDKHYNCSSDVINILYVFSSELTVNVTMRDEANCLANTTQSCSYKWKWFNGSDSSTESDNQILKPKKVGMHRCEATCSVRNKSCTVESMQATVHLESATSGQKMMLLLTLLLVPALGAIGVIMYCWRNRRKRKPPLVEIELQGREKDGQKLLDVKKRRLEEIERQRREEVERQGGEEEERHKLLGLIATIRTKVAEERKKSIYGMTILDNELFVVSRESSEVEVYDSMKFSFIRQWTLKELIDARDMVSCHRNKCLYISDYKVIDLSKEIFRLDPNGKLIKKWSTKCDSGQLSVAYDSNVILASYYHDKLNEYSPDGQLIREIRLSSVEGFSHLRHAIKMTNGHFVVCHGSDLKSYDDGLHRVCIVDADGKLLKSFDEKRELTIEQTLDPRYLSVDGSEFVIVVDSAYHRVFSLDSNLECQKKILSYEHGLRSPHRILLDESNGRIFVTNPDHDSRILIFQGLLRDTKNVTLNS